MTTLPDTIDLMAMAAALEARGGKRRLSGALRNAWRSQSCLADLRQAQDICGVLDQLTAGPLFIESTLTQIQGSLLASAILLYARATHTSGSGNERGAITLDDKKLSAEQRQDHRALIKIRNTALGHVESRAAIEGDMWHVDYLFAKRVSPDTWSFASASASIGFNIDAFAMLKRQLPISADTVAAKARERLDDINKVLKEANPSDAAMMRYAVDPVAWFGSVESARMMLDGAPGVEKTSWLPFR